jgi:hypothetical protein
VILEEAFTEPAKVDHNSWQRPIGPTTACTYSPQQSIKAHYGEKRYKRDFWSPVFGILWI